MITESPPGVSPSANPVFSTGLKKEEILSGLATGLASQKGSNETRGMPQASGYWWEVRADDEQTNRFGRPSLSLNWRLRDARGGAFELEPLSQQG